MDQYLPRSKKFRYIRVQNVVSGVLAFLCTLWVGIHINRSNKSANNFLEVSSNEFSSYSSSASIRGSNTVGDRPIIYTFFQDVNGGYGDGPLIELWKEYWAAAGWEPKVINLETAMQHPDFEAYNEALKEVPLGDKPDYDRLCFLRWLAMAAVGGGYMADVDVLPLWPVGHEKSYKAISDGKFNVHCGARGGEVPCLMSGAAANWHRMAFSILEDGIRHKDKDVKLWSDMLALQDIMANGGGTAVEVSNTVIQGYHVVNWLKSQNNGFDAGTCGQGDARTSIHFSHSITDHLKDVDEKGVHYRHEMRPKLAKEWLAEWAKSCIDESSPFKDFLLSQRPTDDIISSLKDV